jgi:A49-like RNA polymerase I associated factor
MFNTADIDSCPVYASTFSVEPAKDLVFDIYNKKENPISKSLVVGQVDGVHLVGKAQPSYSTYLVARRVKGQLKLHKATPIVVHPEIPSSATSNLIAKDYNARTTLGQVFGTRKRRIIIRYALLILVISSRT